MAVAIAGGWTLDDLARLPDDGNRYEIIGGELFITPTPTTEHENVVARLNSILVPFVLGNKLGHVYHPRSVVRFEGQQAEPDLMVRADTRGLGKRWEDAPKPILVVEVTSRYTRRRDYNQKRDYYLDDVGIEEYWIIDREDRNLHVITRDNIRTVVEKISWAPSQATDPLQFSVRDLFD